MKQIEIKSWTHFQEECFENAWQKDIEKYRSPLVFRGLDDADYRLETTLKRQKGDFRKLERHLLRNFKKYSHNDIVEQNTDWHWLALGQHYGLPTRLLDWTTSPLVGLHFAISDPLKMDCDGAVYAVDFVETHKLLWGNLAKTVKKADVRLFTIEMVKECVPSLSELDRGRSNFLLFFEPPSMDDRIVNQYAVFSIASDANLVLDDWLKRHRSLAKKLIIPKKMKWEFRDRLDQSNITERVLFPGLGGLSAYLKRYYISRK